MARIRRIHAPAVLALSACLLCAFPLRAASYLPMSDQDLMARAPIIVRAQVVSQTVRQENHDGANVLFTIVSLQRLELLKGSIEESFSVRLAGGRLDKSIWVIPGTPVFTADHEVVLFLGPVDGHPGEYRLSEFGLSKFDLVTDSAGRRFAIRPVFGASADLIVSEREPASYSPTPGSAAFARDAASFLEALRTYSRGQTPSNVVLAQPAVTDPGSDRSTEFVNVLGREPGDVGPCDTSVPCLVRWFWDTGVSPNAVVSASGTQSNLHNDEPNCGTDSICDVQNAATQWHSVAQSDVRYSGPTPGGNIMVGLDATSSFDGGTAWNTALGCPVKGVIGLGGPGGNSVFQTFKGDTDYVAASSGQVSMRKVTCNTGYSARVFRAAILHEIGHTVGLGHPDDGQSIHSTTTSTDWSNAVMHSVLPPAAPDQPQTDDIQAIQYYYGTGAAGQASTAAFTFSPTSPVAGTAVSFANASTGSPTAYSWDFGDASAYGTDVNPIHVFTTAGSYTVTLYAGNFGGTGIATKTVAVGAGGSGPSTCTADATTLCLNAGRFKVTADWEKPDGTQGKGTAVSLTADTGYFWFFSASNIEVVTKVLKFCSDPFNAYWVFAAGLTDVKTTLAYTDTKNGTVVVKNNPQSTPFVAVQDTKAFPTCP